MHKMLQPAGWSTPRGYSNGVSAEGWQVYVGGQIGWNAQNRFESDDLVAQVRQALLNIVAILREGGAEPRHLASMTWYFIDKREYLARLKEIGEVYREVLGRHYPAMVALQVSALVEDRAKVEIQAIAVVPPAESSREAR